MLKPVIEVAGVSKEVQDASGTLTILSDISFTLGEGETAAIVGASGSGKSTLLSIMAGLDVPTRGGVKLLGTALFDLNEDQRAAERARHVGFVFQSFQLLGNLTALENVMLPLELAGDANAKRVATDMLARVGLSQRLGHYPRCCPGGSSSALRWPAPLPCSPNCCWRMSPRAAWTSPRVPR